MKRALVLGGGGFIGSHLVNRLKRENFWVRAVDLQRPRYRPTTADEFIVGDLHDSKTCADACSGGFDEVYQLAADMGGAGYISSGKNDADIMYNSALINLNLLRVCTQASIGRIFYSSTACVYPERNQLDPLNPRCSEDSIYPAAPDSEYGWEKLFSERLYLAFARNYGLATRIARLHNIFGPEGSWNDGREKAPAALCRKVAMANDEIEIWGDGQQTRSFLYVDECLEGVLRLMRSDCEEPLNVGSDQMLSIHQLVRLIMDIAGKRLSIRHIDGPLGVRGRTSNNHLIRARLGWAPHCNLREGLLPTYRWIESQVKSAKLDRATA
ncbi:MAG: NAD-dependent epimerase/dehydratase family protein [Polyangiaceae bacterium]|jgi:nucleoside-diphosphate-sugar epimerase